MNLRLIAGLALAAPGIVLGANETGKTTAPRPPPEFNLDNSPVDRDATLPVSFATVVKRAEPCVVYISSIKHVRTSNDMSQLFQDPMMRRFFGPMMPNGGGDGSGGGGGSHTEKQESLGSGVIVSPNGYILTNNHVVEGAEEVKVHIGEDHREYRARVVGRDPEVDVAVLKIEASGLPAAVLGDSDQLQVGDTVLAVGDPFDIGMTVTHGIVSALGRNSVGIERYENFIQTDAPINLGNSGGALLDVRGRVVGINTAILTHTGGSNGVGFAIPINLVRSVADQLIKHGKVSRGLLGVSLQEMTPDLADQFGTTAGALISDVTAGSPAAKAGLQSGDVITKLDGKPVPDYRQLSFAIGELTPGTTVHLEYLRGGKVLHADVVLADRSDARLNGEGNAANANNDTGVLNGVAVQDITQDVRDELHVPVGMVGAVISEVAPDSASALAGLQKGDIILDLDRKPVHNADEAVKLSEQIKGPKVLVRFWRGGATQYVVVDESQAPTPSGNAPSAAPAPDDGGGDDSAK